MSIGIWQIVLILAIVLIIFGAGKLPRVMGDMGKGIRSFKSGLNEEDEKGKAPSSLENSKSDTVSSESKDNDSVKS
jgi:sec-independent protein translocase protein TatA